MTNEAWQKLELLATPNFLDVYIIFNCISLGKVNSVPCKTMAFCHADTTNLLVGGWSNEVPTMHNGDLITSDPAAVVGGQDAFIALWGRARIVFAENYIPLQEI